MSYLLAFLLLLLALVAVAGGLLLFMAALAAWTRVPPDPRRIPPAALLLLLPLAGCLTPAQARRHGDLRYQEGRLAAVLEQLQGLLTEARAELRPAEPRAAAEKVLDAPVAPSRERIRDGAALKDLGPRRPPR